jgi:hypothetical protein
MRPSHECVVRGYRLHVSSDQNHRVRLGHNVTLSRAPVLFSNIKGAAGQDHLAFLLGILNSSACFWHIAQRSHIYETTQEAFAEREWSLAPPTIALMLKKYTDLAELGHECHIRQGMNTGADDVFVLPRRAVPEDGQELFVPLLTMRFSTSLTSLRLMFRSTGEGKVWWLAFLCKLQN